MDEGKLPSAHERAHRFAIRIGAALHVLEAVIHDDVRRYRSIGLRGVRSPREQRNVDRDAAVRQCDPGELASIEAAVVSTGRLSDHKRRAALHRTPHPDELFSGPTSTTAVPVYGCAPACRRRHRR